MAVKAPPATKAGSVVKREPAVIATGIVTLVSTFLFVAPGIGIPIPDTISKVIAMVLTVAAGFGIRSAVTPVKA
jgi:hypothetical protein